MTDWYMRTEPLELKDGSTIKNYHYEFNSTDRVVAKIVEDVFKAIMDIKADRKTEPSEHRDCINCEDASDCAKCRRFEDEPQTDCYVSDLCKHYGDKQICGRCRSRNLFCEKEEPKDEPQTEVDWKDQMWTEAVIASQTENK